jgi:hypothetical protein
MNKESGIMRYFLVAMFMVSVLAPIALAQIENPSIKKSFLPACEPTGKLGLAVTNPNHRCNVYDLLQLVVNLTRWLWYMSIPVAGALFLYAGYLIMTAAGDEGQVGQGKKIITAAVVGFIIVMTSWLLVRTIFYILAPGYTGGLSQ